MHSRNLATVALSALLLAACGDDTTIFSTFSYTNVSASNVTNFESMGNGADAGVDTEVVTTSPGTTGNESTGAGDTIGMSDTSATTEQLDDTTTLGTTADMTSEDPTSGTTEGPTSSLPFPPQGCAHIVEFDGRKDEGERYVVINAEGCPRSAELSLMLDIFGAPGPFTVNLGTPIPCHLYGGTESIAAEEGGTIVNLIGVDDPPAYEVTLFVNGEMSDTFAAPIMLDGNAPWLGHPASPLVPVRRRSDWSWTDIAIHAQGCQPLD